MFFMICLSRGREWKKKFTLPKPSCSSGHRGNGRVVGCISDWHTVHDVLQDLMRRIRASARYRREKFHLINREKERERERET